MSDPGGYSWRHGRTREQMLKADATGPSVPLIMGKADEANQIQLGSRWDRSASPDCGGASSRASRRTSASSWRSCGRWSSMGRLLFVFFLLLLLPLASHPPPSLVILHARLSRLERKTRLPRQHEARGRFNQLLPTWSEAQAGQALEVRRSCLRKVGGVWGQKKEERKKERKEKGSVSRARSRGGGREGGRERTRSTF
ncbi:hypothetical protein VTK73DRAFT_4880 [Phialemonium thermophilum]|uniref:Uncharacterized protein n=1 Tax=Phialemonium thermophilum TaxID=223376 RepID=A0ABR3V580_9PEZI